MRRAAAARTSVKPLHNWEDISSRALLRTHEQAADKDTVRLYLHRIYIVLYSSPLLLTVG